MTDYSYAYTGRSSGKTHIAVEEAYQTHAVCGVGIMSRSDYRPSRAHLQRELCPKCRRHMQALGIDPFALGWREEADGV